MPDMRDAMRKAGIESKLGEKQCMECGRLFTPREPRHRLCPDCAKVSTPRGGVTPHSSSFPEGYPEYFDSDGNLKCEYVTDLAQTIAAHLGQTKLTINQLRAFYGQVKRLESSLKGGRTFKEIYPEICKLKTFANDRSAKGKIPKFFSEFICRNVDKTRDQKAFRSGFVEHFQAVVAYCAGTIHTR